MGTITEKLLCELVETKDIDGFFRVHENEFINQTPKDFLEDILKIKGKTIAQVVKSSGAGDYVYKVFSGSRKPSRNILLSIGFALEMTVEEVQLLLRISKQATLDSRDKRDGIIIYGYANKLSIFEVDDLLYKNHLVTLAKDN